MGLTGPTAATTPMVSWPGIKGNLAMNSPSWICYSSAQRSAHQCGVAPQGSYEICPTGYIRLAILQSRCCGGCNELTSAANTTGLDLDKDIILSELWQRNIDNRELPRLGVPMGIMRGQLQARCGTPASQDKPESIVYCPYWRQWRQLEIQEIMQLAASSMVMVG